MKKTVLAVLAVFLLCGCGNRKRKDTLPTPDTRESVSIAETDFTQKDAERVLQAALDEHCGTASCRVSSVRIRGSNIEGTYTYSDDGNEKTADAVLYNVTVNPNNRSVFAFTDSRFTDSRSDIVPSESPVPDDGKDGEDGDAEKLDLPDKVDENEEGARDDQKVYDESGTQVYRMYMNKGTIEFGGSYTGDSKFIITIMDLSQKVIATPVNMTQAGPISGSQKLDAGYYYVKIEAQGGWELTWNRTFE